MRLGSTPLLSESSIESEGFDRDRFFWIFWEFPALARGAPLRNSSAQRQLESLSPPGLGSLLDQ